MVGNSGRMAVLIAVAFAPFAVPGPAHARCALPFPSLP